MRKMGLEPTRHECHKILSLARLPVPTLPHSIFTVVFLISRADHKGYNTITSIKCQLKSIKKIKFENCSVFSENTENSNNWFSRAFAPAMSVRFRFAPSHCGLSPYTGKEWRLVLCEHNQPPLFSCAWLNAYRHIFGIPANPAWRSSSVGM